METTQIHLDSGIPRPTSMEIEIRGPKHHDIEKQRQLTDDIVIPRHFFQMTKSHNIEFLWNSDPYAPWYAADPCGWLEPAGLTRPAADLFLIYKVNLRTSSVKYVIFMVCFLPPDFSYHWFRLWMLLQEPRRSLKKLQVGSAATDSSCSSWFETAIQDLRPIYYLQNFHPDTPRYAVHLNDLTN